MMTSHLDDFPFRAPHLFPTDPLAQADDELKDLLVNILAKDPCSRLAVSEARAHEWVAHTDRRFSVSDTVKAAPASAAVASGAAAAAAAPVLVTATSTAVTAGAAVRESLSNEGLTSGAFAGAAATAAAAVANNLASLSGRRFRRVVHLGGETVSISEEDVRAAVAEAPSFVLVVSHITFCARRRCSASSYCPTLHRQYTDLTPEVLRCILLVAEPSPPSLLPYALRFLREGQN